MKKIVVLGGGTGLSVLLKGLKLFPIDITAIVSVADDGSSTGRLREEFNIPAVGDLRKVLVALSEVEPLVEDLLQYRFETTSDFTEENAILVAHTKDGEIIEGESNITKAFKQIDYVEYKEKVHATKEVIKSLKQADLIIIGIGSLYTSVIPNLLDEEVVKVIKTSKAKKMYVSNIMTEHGETDNYAVSDCIKEINKYASEELIDVVLSNNGEISEHIKELYKEEKSTPIPLDNDELEKMNIKIIEDNLVKIVNNQVRHDSIRTALDIFTYINNSGDV